MTPSARPDQPVPSWRRRIFIPPLLAIVNRMLAPAQQHRATQFAEVEAAPGRVVFLGDSITEGGLWDEWFPDVAVLNRGIGGERTAGVLSRLDTAIDEPAAVFLLIGTNDLMGLIPHEEIARNVAAILDGIEERAPGTPVFVQSVMPRAKSYREEVQALNRRYVQLVDERPEHIRYVDLWPALATPESTLDRRFTRDRLHLNGRGYRAWVKILEPLVTPFGSPKPEIH
ncbi:GDSL-type esterase/lipase family protein [Amycolatopsis sp. NBC_00345]|uniref:GDSL-type esterase/lipase family protein n=1 Tax=Amycolatopsis sp. NBC_00345 TaxID=2975955 RepID=UPI002E26C631